MDSGQFTASGDQHFRGEPKLILDYNSLQQIEHKYHTLPRQRILSSPESILSLFFILTSPVTVRELITVKLIAWIKRWKIERQAIERYSLHEREPFFDLVLTYLQHGPVKLVDVGCGHSDFVDRAQYKNPDADVWLLDGNPRTVQELLQQGRKARLYRAPEYLPFNNSEVEFIHCSHLIEHLCPSDLYKLLNEFNRILADQGVLAISAPLFWDGFYNDLSHIRPYPPNVLDKYLTANAMDKSFTRISIGQFRREALCYRYHKRPVFSNFGLRANAWFLDFLVISLKKIINLMGIYQLSPSGYTIIYRKESSASCGADQGCN